MLVYRIVNEEKRTHDLSGTGAFKYGGRWNSAGLYALYTCEHEALCLLELLVHLEKEDMPENLFIMEINIMDDAPILLISEKELPAQWRIPENIKVKEMGNQILKAGKHLGICAPSAVLPQSNNYILNPLYKDFNKMVSVKNIFPYDVDGRLRK